MPDGAPVAVSVVSALLDETETLRDFVRRVRATLDDVGDDYEIVLVDDGSGPECRALLRELEEHEDRLRVIELTRNFGQVAALACGLFAARGQVAVTLDSDLQDPPEEIPKLLVALVGGADIANGARGDRYEGLVRWLGSRGVHWLARGLTGARIQDFGGNFRAYRRNVIEALRVSWASGKPLLPLALWLGFSVEEVTLRHEPRRAGRSRYNLYALARINFDLITSFTTLPIAVLGVAGAGLMVAGVAAFVWCVAGAAGAAALGASLAAVIVGSVFFAAGVVGLYVGRVYRHLAGGASAPYVIRRGPRRDRPA